MGEEYEVGGVYSLPQRINMNGIKEIVLGEGFALFVGKLGEIYGIGRNEYGQLGDGTTQSSSTFIRCTELEKWNFWEQF